MAALPPEELHHHQSTSRSLSGYKSKLAERGSNNYRAAQGTVEPDPWPALPLYSAGGLFGRGASQGGYFNNAQIPFGASLVVTARTVGVDNVGAWIKVSGTAGLPVVLGPHGVELPTTARLELQGGALVRSQALARRS